MQEAKKQLAKRENCLLHFAFCYYTLPLAPCPLPLASHY
jgi:hypothetical protein